MEAGQGTTTRAFGESNGTLYAGGGAVHGLQVVTLVRSDKAEPAEAVEVEIMTTVEI